MLLLEHMSSLLGILQLLFQPAILPKELLDLCALTCQMRRRDLREIKIAFMGGVHRIVVEGGGGAGASCCAGSSTLASVEKLHYGLGGLA